MLRFSSPDMYRNAASEVFHVTSFIPVALPSDKVFWEQQSERILQKRNICSAAMSCYDLWNANIYDLQERRQLNGAVLTYSHRNHLGLLHFRSLPIRSKAKNVSKVINHPSAPLKTT